MKKIGYIALSLLLAMVAVVAVGCNGNTPQRKALSYGVNMAVEMAMPEIIPTPKDIKTTVGVGTIMSVSANITYASPLLEPVAEYLASYMGLESEQCDDAGIIRLDISPELASEEYRLVVNQRGICVSGGDYGGVFNGVTTLLQLLPAEVYSGTLDYPIDVPFCEISDAPRYNYRGFMLDVCRTWMNKESVMSYIDLLAYHKINTLRMHLTDDEAWRIEIESHPELAVEGGFRGGDAKIWPRYGKWNERWGGYYTKEDMREIIAYAKVRNIEVIPEIDLPGHSLCIATLHPEVLCDYQPNTSRSFGYDTRSAFCASKEENYILLDDILREVCALFPSRYIHIGGDEVDMSQWRRCPDCQSLMREQGMATTAELQQYFMMRVADILARYDKLPAVWNEAIEGGRLSADTRVYGWEGVKECRAATAEGYSTVVMPGQYFYFDMKQSLREAGHDWAAIFDWTKVYGFTPKGVGFTPLEEQNILGLEASFFSELYASHSPESPDFLHYQTFPRMVAFAEIAWIDSDYRDDDAFYKSMVSHYDRLDAMGVAYRLNAPEVRYDNGVLSASTDDGGRLFYSIEIDGVVSEYEYVMPIETATPARYAFISRRGEASSPMSAVASYFKTMTPAFNITSSMGDSERFSFDKAEGYGRLARTSRAAGVGDWVMFTFDVPVKCRRMVVATGNFQLPRYTFENGYVEVSHDGKTFKRIGELDCGKYTIINPNYPIKAVRMVCTSEGNGAEWVSIQPPTIYPLL